MVDMETYRRGHNGNDSKSFDGLNPSVGSNPTVSATKKLVNLGVYGLFSCFSYSDMLYCRQINICGRATVENRVLIYA